MTASTKMGDKQPAAGTNFSQELNSILAPYRAENRQILNEWIESGAFCISYKSFLVETYYYIKQRSPLMSAATARLTSNLALKAYMTRHIADVAEHEQWLLNDLAQLGVDRCQVLCSTPLHETMNLIGSQLYVIHCLNPVGLLGYMYMLESQPLNGDSLTLIQETFDIPPQAMTYLTGQGKADPEPGLELAEIIDRRAVTSREREAVIFSAVSGLSNLNRLLARIRSGDYTTCLPQLIPIESRYL